MVKRRRLGERIARRYENLPFERRAKLAQSILGYLNVSAFVACSIDYDADERAIVISALRDGLLVSQSIVVDVPVPVVFDTLENAQIRWGQSD